MIRRVTFHLLLFVAVSALAQPVCHVTKYDEDDGLAHSHVTQLLQDGNGFMWFSTWNGLCRFDGYEFQTFKPMPGDGCRMTTDRIRDIALTPDGQIICRVDDNDYYRFDTRTYRFHNLDSTACQEAATSILRYRQSRSLLGHNSPLTWTDAHGTEWTLTKDGRLMYRDKTKAEQVLLPTGIASQELSFACHDKQGNLWVLGSDGVYKLTTDVERTKPVTMPQPAQVKCLFHDRNGRYWITTRENMMVAVYSEADDRLLGYLGSDGRLSVSPTSFRSPVYCMHQTADGTLWLGSKPDGLFRLRETRDGVFMMEHLSAMAAKDVYHIAEDRFGRLWIATFSGGICCSDNPQAGTPRFVTPQNYPATIGQRARYIHITKTGVLMVAATDGLIIGQLEKDLKKMRFHRHQREANRKESLSSGATMDILEDGRGRLFVSTESGGVNMIEDSDLTADVLHFKHLNTASHLLPSDVALSLTRTDGDGVMVVSNHLVSLLDSNGHLRVLDANYFGKEYRFSDAHPMKLGKGRWLFGLNDGAFITSSRQMTENRHAAPAVVLTGISVQGGDNRWAAEPLDTLVLQPHERSLTVHFAAIDYSATSLIRYAFSLLTANDRDSTAWNYIGHDRSATLLDLKPGTYQLLIRSTNADGQWTDNVRQLVVIVKPTFWESTSGRLLLALLILCIVGAVVATLLYIRHIKRKQHETLEAYLALMERKSADQTVSTPATGTADPMMQRVMTFIEQNISNSDATVGDMAEAAATSRSGLQRKVKQTMGITPQDLLREARIKRACQLLRTTDKTVAETAYACGFTDPKYFSRCFRQSVGLSPTEYKSAV